VQSIVETGILEVEGVRGETFDIMMNKYQMMDEDALREFENADGVIEGTAGFRLLRLPRLDEVEFPDINPVRGVRVCLHPVHPACPDYCQITWALPSRLHALPSPRLHAQVLANVIAMMAA
jgi:hypothetical protein